MRVHFQMSGGIGYFPGLAAPRTIDVDALDSDTRARIRRVVEESQFFSTPSRNPARKGAADYQTYTITVEDGARHHTVVVSDPVPAALQGLVDQLKQLAGF
jgi:hypothetical protein